MKFSLVFLCGARDFHAMDWYRSAQEFLPKNKLSILTDLIAGEGFKKIILETDSVEKMLIIDKFLLKSQSSLGNIWRNFIKLLVLPIQVFILKSHKNKNPDTIYYAHSMYYIWLAFLANVEYIGTPQGSDILIKPYKSFFYKYLTIKSLKKAKFITVDSTIMKEKCFELAKIHPFIVQNGIDISSIMELKKNINEEKKYTKKEKVVSLRAMTDLYRIKELLKGRGVSKQPISFIYPFYDKLYKSEINKYLTKDDEDLGRLDRLEMYTLLHKTWLTLSIPYSDSSPRSVYEAIFCGSPVCITYHPYYELLPKSIQKRIIIVDLKDNKWFNFAVKQAKEISRDEFLPDQKIIDQFDQKKSFKIILELLKNHIKSTENEYNYM